MSLAESKQYQKTVEELKEKIKSELGDSIDSLVLYGSAARGEYKGVDSDIDILIIAKDETSSTYNKIRKIATEIDLKNSTATTLVYLSRKEFKRNARLSSPFLEEVAKEGIVLYDNGIFERFRESLVKVSR
ncbi:MAG: nucleotidyltransferase domain-containing protein [Nitrososphaerales archaeon]